jgi:2-keto-3-deoxy-L-rhamnonate aldolase RhmA
MSRVVAGVAFAVLAFAVAAGAAAQSGAARIYNTVKQKLEAGEQVVGGTITSNDPAVYCTMASAGYDFLWIEMQHSPLTYQDVARMIWACRDAPAIPFIRVPDATAGDIQKATDIGALGVIVPLVESVDKVRDTVRFAMYPPEGIRSLGGGQYRALWGEDYRETANENIMIVAMIESPAGVGIADQVASVPGVDVIFAASTDIGSFSGLRQGDPLYEQLIDDIQAAAEDAGVYLAGPQAWMDRDGFSFFQAPSDTGLLRLGIETSLASSPRGVAPIEGEED